MLTLFSKKIKNSLTGFFCLFFHVNPILVKNILLFLNACHLINNGISHTLTNIHFTKHAKSYLTKSICFLSFAVCFFFFALQHIKGNTSHLLRLTPTLFYYLPFLFITASIFLYSFHFTNYAINHTSFVNKSIKRNRYLSSFVKCFFSFAICFSFFVKCFCSYAAYFTFHAIQQALGLYNNRKGTGSHSSGWDNNLKRLYLHSSHNGFISFRCSPGCCRTGEHLKEYHSKPELLTIKF